MIAPCGLLGEFYGVTQAEYDALMAFYVATAGDSWTNNTGWGNDPNVGAWNGVTSDGTNVTSLILAGNNLVGAAAATLDGLVFLDILKIGVNSLTSIDVSANVLLTEFFCNNNAISILDVSTNVLLTDLRCQGNSLTALVLGTNTALETVYCSYNALGTLDLSTNIALGLFDCENNGMNQTEVDATILSIYTTRASYTDATPALDISATNAAPSGILQYSAAPSTGKEYIYALINDDDAEGFNKWGITYTA